MFAWSGSIMNSLTRSLIRLHAGEIPLCDRRLCSRRQPGREEDREMNPSNCPYDTVSASASPWQEEGRAKSVICYGTSPLLSRRRHYAIARVGRDRERERERERWYAYTVLRLLINMAINLCFIRRGTGCVEGDWGRAVTLRRSAD